MSDEGMERWDEWGRRMLARPDSGVHQLLGLGLSRDTAFLMVMMGSIHTELIDIENLLGRVMRREDDDDDWKRPR